ncbi:hypothetical protein NPIL_262851 [Nephila pilipes]|uniref:Uncharacterized protein n=1 Tax=Nephila pilipes TaxID=299642 RepID=A0A8X6TSP4_NEPPI|nr:hypothetical protein NPIL_262851 [Nephila pilipes]
MRVKNLIILPPSLLPPPIAHNQFLTEYSIWSAEVADLRKALCQRQHRPPNYEPEKGVGEGKCKIGRQGPRSEWELSNLEKREKGPWYTQHKEQAD